LIETQPEFIKWRAIALFLVAGENGNDGLLPPVARLAWRLRLEEVKIAETASALTEVGVVYETPQAWVVTDFKERPYSESYERMKRYRKRNKARNSNGECNGNETDNESISISSSCSDSDSEEGGVGGETPALRNASSTDGVVCAAFPSRFRRDGFREEARRRKLPAGKGLKGGAQRSSLWRGRIVCRRLFQSLALLLGQLVDMAEQGWL
jgi:hypothetical protein